MGAGIREEIWLRLGFMTFLVWIGFRLVERFTRHVSDPQVTVVGIANLLAALGFAAIHIPQAKALSGPKRAISALYFCGERHARSCIRLALLAPRSDRGNARTLRP